ncbi:MAG: hypothetical protein GYA50_00645, partial [Eubacteriaceae bacterium]|nr:hypothetical protein [Eubacteriaceae bacterium]
MKWFQPIECDKTVKKPLVCDVASFEDDGYNENSFKIGKEIKNWDENTFIKASEKKCNGVPDDVLQNTYMIPIYSERLVNEINNENINGVQYLKIHVKNYYNENYNEFCIANFLNYIEAFNYEKSIFNRFSDDFPNPNVRGQIAGVTKFVLNKEKIKGFDIIRLSEYNSRFFVSEKFVDLFKKN